MTTSSAYVAVSVDPDVCQGHGECVRIASDIFQLDEDLTAHCAPRQPLDRLKELEHAAAVCPAEAISVEVTE